MTLGDEPKLDRWGNEIKWGAQQDIALRDIVVSHNPLAVALIRIDGDELKIERLNRYSGGGILSRAEDVLFFLESDISPLAFIGSQSELDKVKAEWKELS